ncbi:hypothetical protein AMECASPLE_036896 [Ameca splendens]|uniref:Transmembrane protein n=1 Tax=Ameca splendens TaxID=208324 RepID=A0ABV0ZH06_9TELE
MVRLWPLCVGVAAWTLLGLAVASGFSALYWPGVCFSAGWFLVGGVCLVVFTMSIWTCGRMCGIAVAVVLGGAVAWHGSVVFAWLARMLVVLCLEGGATRKKKALCGVASGPSVAPICLLGWCLL